MHIFNRGLFGQNETEWWAYVPSISRVKNLMELSMFDGFDGCQDFQASLFRVCSRKIIGAA
jgi:hypothetical protein